MQIGLIDVDGHNFPNLCLMKISAWHKARGDTVEWWNGLKHYGRVYKSKVFTEEYSPEMNFAINADEVMKGGTGYGLHNGLPHEIEHIYPDYSLYPQYTEQTAYGFLTRGCPRRCPYCIVPCKEGVKSRKVADLAEFWKDQRYIKLLDPNILACAQREELLHSLAQSGAWVDFTQGLDIRFTTRDVIKQLNAINVKQLHFAWDNPREDLSGLFANFKQVSRISDPRRLGVYVLTNFNTTHQEDLYRINTLSALGYRPYVMIYEKSTAPKITRYLQRWCNNPRIREVQPDFSKYNPKRA